MGRFNFFINAWGMTVCASGLLIKYWSNNRTRLSINFLASPMTPPVHKAWHVKFLEQKLNRLCIAFFHFPVTLTIREFVRTNNQTIEQIYKTHKAYHVCSSWTIIQAIKQIKKFLDWQSCVTPQVTHFFLLDVHEAWHVGFWNKIMHHIFALSDDPYYTCICPNSRTDLQNKFSHREACHMYSSQTIIRAIEQIKNSRWHHFFLQDGMPTYTIANRDPTYRFHILP